MIPRRSDAALPAYETDHRRLDPNVKRALSGASRATLGSLVDSSSDRPSAASPRPGTLQQQILITLKFFLGLIASAKANRDDETTPANRLKP